MGLFDGKKGLILGVFNDHSIAWAIGKKVLEEGATVGFSHLPDRPDDARQKNRNRVAQLTSPFPNAKFLVPLDVKEDAHVQAVADQAKAELGTLDFILHAIANAPLDELKKPTVEVSRGGFLSAMDVSVYSFLALTNAVRPILNPHASVLTLTYFGGERAVPGYNLMGLCKAALECSVKYLAYDLGPQQVRVNAISAGPVRTMSGKGAGVDDMLKLYEGVAPLGRNVTLEELGETGAFLLSEKSGGITGEILHLDCGYNVMGSPGRLAEKMKL